MSTFTFKPEKKPFPRWMGPYSPSRGRTLGFRFLSGKLGTWVGDDAGRSFWSASGTAATAIAKLVASEWHGGRVLFLPNGYVIKPLQEDDEVNKRVLIGRVSGGMLLLDSYSDIFDMGDHDDLDPGDKWPGPTTTGLECVIQVNGALKCQWCHPTTWGKDEITEELRPADKLLGKGFRVARPGDATGRVRITVNGHVITNRKVKHDVWESRYVGWIDPTSWPDWKKWIKKEGK